MGRRERDVMRRLAAARPPRLDAAAAPGTRERELGRAFGRVHEPVGAGRRAPGAWWTRAGRGAGLVATAVAAAVAVALLPADGPDPVRRAGPGVGSGADGGTGGDVLLAAAARLEGGAARKGAYWYQEEVRGETHRVPGADGARYVVDERTALRRWTAGERPDQWSETRDLGARPGTPADVRAWRTAGSPRRWALPGGGTLRYRADGRVGRDAPGGRVDVVPIGVLGPGDLRDLPTGAAALRERVRTAVERKYQAPSAEVSRIVTSTLVDLAVHLPTRPGLRAAAYRALALTPGVRSLGSLKDRSGRPGRGVAVPDGDGRTELRLVLDAETGAPLGTLTVAVRAVDGRPEGAVLRYTTVVAQRWTGEAPPFDTDRSPGGPRGPGGAPEPSATVTATPAG
ncbi:CU044_5270 family protein [Streptomyces sp. JNUCC 64]